MKITDKKKPIDTLPKGIWESSNPAQDKSNQNATTASTDLQGNGYPANGRTNSNNKNTHK